jgi:hypothetical protein
MTRYSLHVEEVKLFNNIKIFSYLFFSIETDNNYVLVVKSKKKQFFKIDPVRINNLIAKLKNN